MQQPYSLDLKLMADDVICAYRRKGFQAWTYEYRYPTNRVVMPGSAAQLRPEPISFLPDCLFIWLGTFITIRNSNGVEGFRPTIGVQLKDADSGYVFSSIAFGQIPAQLQAGSAGDPYILPCPYLFRPAGRAVVTFQTLNTAVLGTVQLDLWGVALYTKPFTRDLLFPEH